MSNTTLTQVRQSLREKAVAVLVHHMTSDAWDTIAELQVLIGQHLDKFLVRHHPEYTIDWLEIRRVKVKGAVDMLELDLDIIRLDGPSSWSVALLVNDPSQP